MNELRRPWFASPVIGVVMGLAMLTTPMGCSGEGDDGSGASGGSAAEGSGTGGASSSGGDAATGGEAGDGALFGEACTDDSVCPMRGEFAGNCRAIWPGGYCTAGCSFFGDCGPGNVCNMGLGTCLKSCEYDSDCREGYRCWDEYGGCEPAL